jgi:hypothetical protein
MPYNYKLENFISSYSKDEIKIKIFDKKNTLVWNLEPSKILPILKGRSIIISGFDTDILIDFETEDIAASAIVKLNNIKKQYFTGNIQNNLYYSKLDLINEGSSQINFNNLINSPISTSEYILDVTTGLTLDIINKYSTNSIIWNISCVNLISNDMKLIEIVSIWNDLSFNQDITPKINIGNTTGVIVESILNNNDINLNIIISSGLWKIKIIRYFF